MSKRIINLLIIPLCCLTATTYSNSAAAASGAPALNLDIAIESVGIQPETARGTIAFDALDQPHIVSNNIRQTGFEFKLFSRINGNWQEQVVGTSSMWGGGLLSRPRIAIDPINNRGWISGWLTGATNRFHKGAVVWRFNNMTTGPTMHNNNGQPYRHKFAGTIWGGLVDFDPRFSGGIILGGPSGMWRRLNANGSTVSSGQINPGVSIEKMNFRISAVGDQVVYHAISGGHAPEPSGYQNSARAAAGLGRVIYADVPPYGDQRFDYFHPGLGIDSTDPNIAYIAWTSDGLGRARTNASKDTIKNLYLNVFDGNELVRGPRNGILVDTNVLPRALPTGGWGNDRTPVEFAPAPGGGAWLAYVTNGVPTPAQQKLRLVYVDQQGGLHDPFPEQADPRLVAENVLWTAIGTDSQGSLHIAYGVGSNVFYRKYTTNPAGRVRFMEFDKITQFEEDGPYFAVYNVTDTRTVVFSPITNTSSSSIEIPVALPDISPEYLNGSPIEDEFTPMTVFEEIGRDGSGAWNYLGMYDLRGDGRQQAYFYNPPTRSVGYWPISPTGENEGWTLMGSGGIGWNLVGIYDMNDSGTKDFVWHRPATGTIGYWAINPETMRSGGFVEIADGGTAWTPVAIADITGNGLPNIIWEGPASASLVGFRPIGTWNIDFEGNRVWQPLGFAGNDWRIDRIHDMDGNGVSDIVFRNINGRSFGAWRYNSEEARMRWTPIGTGGFDFVPLGVGSLPSNTSSESTSFILWGNPLNADIGTWEINSQLQRRWEPRVGNALLYFDPDSEEN